MAPDSSLLKEQTVDGNTDLSGYRDGPRSLTGAYYVTMIVMDVLIFSQATRTGFTFIEM